MPEGPELYKNSQMVNEVCKGRIFSGKIVKSAVSTKNPDVKFPARDYTIHAESRGKEMALILTSLDSDCKREGLKKEKDCEQKRLRILFRFGMSGKFTFGSIKEMHKHAHLNFYTKEKPLMVLSFVDVRRFVFGKISGHPHILNKRCTIKMMMMMVMIMLTMTTTTMAH